MSPPCPQLGGPSYYNPNNSPSPDPFAYHSPYDYQNNQAPSSPTLPRLHFQPQLKLNTHSLQSPLSGQQQQQQQQQQQSYFPPGAYLSSDTGPAAASASNQTSSGSYTNIDDLAYRYSAEFDRARGTPTVGLYAQDGLWDDEDHIDPPPVRTTASSSKVSLSLPIPKGRSRSSSVTVTVPSMQVRSPVLPEEKEKHKSHHHHHWGWTKKTSTMNSPTIAVEEKEKIPGPITGLKKQKSKGLLRGKGRKGELIVNVPSETDDSFEAPPPPMPSTPASFLTQSPASQSGPFFSPITYSSPTFDSPLPTTESTTAAKPSKATSSWKRGVQKIFRSKSSAALRESALKESTPPPLPNLPRPTNHSLDKPFTSTPPLGGSRRFEVHSVLSMSTPPSATSESFVLPSHPSLPVDPFASSLDLSSNNPTPPLTSPLARPSLRHNSPSLRDLKSFIPHKPTLSKAKSLAQLHHGSHSAPAEKTEFFPQSKLAKRMSSIWSLSSHVRDSSPPVDVSALEPPRSQMALEPPIESPPLLPPHPPYYAAKRSASIPSIITDVSTESDSITPPPTAPLPPVPSSPSTSNLQAPLHRSASGAVLLPRSRSTSMSLKAPPTSSSFFDLYEQLGIWPSADKEKEQKVEQDKENMPPVANIETNQTMEPSESSIAGLAPLPASASFTSNTSWDAALKAFPDAPEPSKMDFGGPHIEDDDIIQSMADQSMVADAGDRSDDLSISAYATSSRRESQPMTLNQSTSTNGNTASSSSRPAGNQRSSRSSGRRAGRRSGGSGHSSRESSPERRKSNRDHLDVESSDDSSDEDEVPLSKLHPAAAAAQAEERKARRAARALEKMERITFSAKFQGRNPGGVHGWNGEGGVPADILSNKLERVLLLRARKDALAAAMAQSEVPSDRRDPDRRPSLHSHHSQREQNHIVSQFQESLYRAQSQNRGGPSAAPSSWRPAQAPAPINTRPTIQGVTMMPSAISPTDMSFGRLPSANRVDPAFATAMQAMASSSGSSYDPMSRKDSSATTATVSSQDCGSRGPTVPYGTRAPSRQDEGEKSDNVTRSNTVATQRSVASSSLSHRSRAVSNALPPSSTFRQEESSALHSRSVTEPLPKPQSSHTNRSAIHAPAVIGALDGKKVALELHQTTTARDVLVATYHRGDLQDASVGMSWVLYEIFAELGLERQIREYEQLLPIYKGWDQSAKFNCFMFKQTNRGSPTWARTIPGKSPFLGSWVQYETKKGKWSKRWLETRGGQVFLAKNEKNKDEIQINTLFFDVHTLTRGYDSPKQSVFIMKRVEPASSFENPSDYMHVFSCEESLAFKLMAAIYDAKSYTLAMTYPALLNPSVAATPSPTAGTGTGIQRRSTLSTQHQHHQQGPLISIGKTETDSAFTGKGLLKF